MSAAVFDACPSYHVCSPYVSRPFAVYSPYARRIFAICPRYIRHMSTVYLPYVRRISVIPNLPFSRSMRPELSSLIYIIHPNLSQLQCHEQRAILIPPLPLLLYLVHLPELSSLIYIIHPNLSQLQCHEQRAILIPPLPRLLYLVHLPHQPTQPPAPPQLQNPTF